MTERSLDYQESVDRIQRALEAMDLALDPERRGGPRNLPVGVKHDRSMLLGIWTTAAFDELAKSTLPTIHLIVKRLEDAEVAVRAVSEVEPGWDKLPPGFASGFTYLWEHHEWRRHNQRAAVRLLLKEFRGLRDFVLERCSWGFQSEWETINGSAWRRESGSFPLNENQRRA